MAGNGAHPSSFNSELATHATSYHHFMLAVKWVAIVLAAFLAFTTLWFATPAGFPAGLVAGAVVLFVGVIAMGHGLGHSSERGGHG